MPESAIFILFENFIFYKWYIAGWVEGFSNITSFETIYTCVHSRYNSTQLSNQILFILFLRIVQKTLIMENLATYYIRKEMSFISKRFVRGIIITIFQNKRCTYFCFQHPYFPAAISLHVDTFPNFVANIFVAEFNHSSFKCKIAFALKRMCQQRI